MERSEDRGDRLRGGRLVGELPFEISFEDVCKELVVGDAEPEKHLLFFLGPETLVPVQKLQELGS